MFAVKKCLRESSCFMCFRYRTALHARFCYLNPILFRAQSESLHREAYNAVFREFEVDYNWSPEYYDELQNKVNMCISKIAIFRWGPPTIPWRL